MRTTKIILLLAFFLGFTFACQEEEKAPQTQEVTFELSLSNPQANDRVATNDPDGAVESLIPECSEESIAAVHIQIMNYDGTEVVFEGYLYPQYFPALGKWQLAVDFLEPGEYMVSSFVAVDENGDPLYAVPEAGSDYAIFVNSPLNHIFHVYQGEKVKNEIELLCIHPGEVPRFGVKVFEFDVISLFNIYFFENYCDPYEGHLKGDVYAYVVLPQDNDGDGYYDYYGSTEVEGLTCLTIPDKWSVDDSYEYVEIYVYTTGHGVLYAYVNVALLKYYKDKVIHIFYDCDWRPDWCEPCDCRHDD